MAVERGEQTRFWREIEALLAGARETRPLHHAEALLDLDRLDAEHAAAPPLARLAEALDGWDGRLLLTASDSALAPTVRPGDRLVIDTEAAPGEGDLVLAYAGGALLVRQLARRGGRSWLVAGVAPASPIGPQVAIIGAVVELRRPLAPTTARTGAG